MKSMKWNTSLTWRRREDGAIRGTSLLGPFTTSQLSARTVVPRKTKRAAVTSKSNSHCNPPSPPQASGSKGSAFFTSSSTPFSAGFERSFVEAMHSKGPSTGSWWLREATVEGVASGGQFEVALSASVISATRYFRVAESARANHALAAVLRLSFFSLPPSSSIVVHRFMSFDLLL